VHQLPLPAPDAEGIYHFPNDLQQTHRLWQDHLTARHHMDDSTIMKVTAPFTGDRYLIGERRALGRPVVVIEPHHDDFALSASGLFLTQPRPLTVITVFTRSISVHPSVTPTHASEDAISALRAAESCQALRPLRAAHHLLGHTDARPPYRPYSSAVLDQVTADLETIVSGLDDAELLAPAAVTRHPDHLLVHQAARWIGCRWFWEDVAFWQTYALSADDRHLFQIRVGDQLVPELVDITGATLDKLTLLYLHASQLQPLAAMYRPIRYAWTTGAGLPQRLTDSSAARYAERFYRLETS
jgi:LmbE family N-acetylglucosaminyl deacetylase